MINVLDTMFCVVKLAFCCEKKLHISFIMATERRPELRIKVFPEDLVNNNKLQILQKLRNTNALILNLTENIKGNVFNQPFPFITFQRVSSSEQLPKNLKLDGDPWSDFFITLNSFKHQSSTRQSSSNSGKVLITYRSSTRAFMEGLPSSKRIRGEKQI